MSVCCCVLFFQRATLPQDKSLKRSHNIKMIYVSVKLTEEPSPLFFSGWNTRKPKRSWFWMLSYLSTAWTSPQKLHLIDIPHLNTNLGEPRSSTKNTWSQKRIKIFWERNSSEVITCTDVKCSIFGVLLHILIYCCWKSHVPFFTPRHIHPIFLRSFSLLIPQNNNLRDHAPLH